MEKATILATRLMRQRLIQPVTTDEEYRHLFTSLQPISPIYFSCPGDPPTIVHRTTLDDRAINSDWREVREIVKGRFLRGTIGYVFSEELELYANAFQRPLEKFNRNQELVYNALAHVGPLTPRQLKEETGLLNKEIMPILHRLQEAFLVYEDQVDTDWERAWYIFSDEWLDINIDPNRWATAAQEVLKRFIHSQVFANTEQIKDWSGWSIKNIKHLLQLMQTNDNITPCNIDGLGEGWICTEDTAIENNTPTPSVFILHKADPIVRANITELKRRFEDLEVLQYLLIDGEFQGAVCGHWRIGPHDVEDIVLEPSIHNHKSRKPEIINAVASIYHPPSHNILCYNGEEIRNLEA